MINTVLAMFSVMGWGKSELGTLSVRHGSVLSFLISVCLLLQSISIGDFRLPTKQEMRRWMALSI